MSVTGSTLHSLYSARARVSHLATKIRRDGTGYETDCRRFGAMSRAEPPNVVRAASKTINFN